MLRSQRLTLSFHVPLTRYCFLKVSRKIVVCIYHTFDYNSGIKNDFTKYLKEISWQCSN